MVGTREPSPPRGAPATVGLTSDDAVPILLVDDQPANLDALEATLASSGCRFVLARSADQALLALLDQDFAAIVLDVMMPGMSGFELATMIKRRQRTQQVPILFLTARMMEQQDALRGYGTGAVDYLTKPFDPQILRAKIAVFVDLYRKRRALARMNVELQRQIADRQKMSEALRRANEDLEARVNERTLALAEASRRKDEFLAMLAHELRTPLSALRTAVEVLRMTAPEGEDPQRVAVRDIVQRQVRQLTRLTDDLLDVSRITRDKVTLQREPQVLARVVDAAVEAVRPLVQVRAHTLTVEPPADDVEVDGDYARLVQVFTNLLDNAARYSPTGSRIRLSGRVSGAEVAVTVADDGVGIDPQLLPRVFDLFMQGHTAPEPGQGGLGIGLPLARRLTEMHGGSLTAFSAGPGRGSEFTVRLPVLPRGAATASAAGSAAAEPAPALPSGQRVLIVEDNLDAADTLRVMLSAWGQDARVAHDGETALAMANEFRPQVVLLDVGLPNLHGYEVARRLRQQAWCRDTLLIATTGWGREVDRHGEAAGIDHRLLKPVDPAALRRILATGSRGQAAV